MLGALVLLRGIYRPVGGIEVTALVGQLDTVAACQDSRRIIMYCLGRDGVVAMYIGVGREGLAGVGVLQGTGLLPGFVLSTDLNVCVGRMVGRAVVLATCLEACFVVCISVADRFVAHGVQGVHVTATAVIGQQEI